MVWIQINRLRKLNFNLTGAVDILQLLLPRPADYKRFYQTDEEKSWRLINNSFQKIIDVLKL